MHFGCCCSSNIVLAVEFFLFIDIDSTIDCAGKFISWCTPETVSQSTPTFFATEKLLLFLLMMHRHTNVEFNTYSNFELKYFPFFTFYSRAKHTQTTHTFSMFSFLTLHFSRIQLSHRRRIQVNAQFIRAAANP